MKKCSWCYKKIELSKEKKEENNIKIFENGTRYSKDWGYFCCEECFNDFFDIHPKKKNGVS